MSGVNQRITAEVHRLLPDFRNVDVTQVRLLSGGYSNENYHFALRDSRYVIRLPGLSQAHHDRIFERTLRQALPQSLTPHAVAEDGQRGVLITAYVDARSPVRRTGLNARRSA
jgi:aminoglycoside phosphotransferase (APT) family kinase protein